MRTGGQKILRIFGPFAVYYLVYNAAFVLLFFLLKGVAGLAGGEWPQRLETQQAAVTGILGGLSMLVGILPLGKSLREELAQNASETDRRSLPDGLLTVAAGFTSSIGLNILFSLSGAAQQSESYQSVAKDQYAVPLLVGILLYGIVSPLAEEVVFRGILFNRMRKDFPPGMAILLSGVLFGLYHGNMVQGIYGTLMGVLMAYLYERMGRFEIPCLFHMTANLTVYLTAQASGLHERLFTAPVAAGLLLVTAGVLTLVGRRSREQKK